MTRAQLLEFMRAQRYAVQATVTASGDPQAAVVGIVLSDDFEIFIDTLSQSRKAQNLKHNASIAFVIGGIAPGDERTVQYEGIADEPNGVELDQLKAQYLAKFPGGYERQSWPGLIYVRARPTWIRYSDFRCDPPVIIEYDRSQLASLA